MPHVGFTRDGQVPHWAVGHRQSGEMSDHRSAALIRSLGDCWLHTLYQYRSQCFCDNTNCAL
jgi:hypothetical protein